MKMLGIDVGGSGIKGAVVDTETGKLLTPRYRVPTPQPSKSRAVAEAVATVVEHFAWKPQPVGYGFPAVVQHGITRTAANIHRSWVDANAAALFAQATGCPARVINDADAAGIAEMRFGAGRGQSGVVLIVTVGTGLGTALFTDGYLVPNTELGHIEIRGKDAERRATDAARVRKGYSWSKWAARFDEYLRHIERLLWPDLIIVGGGVSKSERWKNFAEYLTVKTRVVPAQLRNEAGIVGAALVAEALAESQ